MLTISQLYYELKERLDSENYWYQSSAFRTLTLNIASPKVMPTPEDMDPSFGKVMTVEVSKYQITAKWRKDDETYGYDKLKYEGTWEFSDVEAFMSFFHEFNRYGFHKVQFWC